MSNKLSNYIKVKEGKYLSRQDPNFFQKFLEQNPNIKRAFDQNEKTDTKNDTDHVKSIINNTDHKKEKKYILNITLLIILFLFASLLNKESNTKVNSIAENNKTSIVSPMDKPFVIKEELSDDEKLKIKVIKNALYHYKAKNGKYPDKLSDLTQSLPFNWLSYIPLNVSYDLSKNGYKLKYKNVVFNCGCVPEQLELHFYKDTNQLALVSDNEILRLYSVASAKKGSEMPYTESMVTERVVYPNGGTGVFGTRGIVLERNYALHGTDQEQLIGQNVSHGCIRMTNKDIEELYPYISIGTKFKVVYGTPQDEPKYKKKLPVLEGKIKVEKESNKKKKYHWNH